MAANNFSRKGDSLSVPEAKNASFGDGWVCKKLKMLPLVMGGAGGVILDTHIFEISVTIPGIKYVIDPGLFEMDEFTALSISRGAIR
ncbi:hypothetical protein H5410_025064 [Solanum commersonii]|uniref:Uncharacterized protein n=1 Tax=Solanum commersonii TaxID=4109 RepID=A0A9J5YWV7_SOLCO|nr:hypothetical protein H5410_025064 [Solanum commersonii]